MLRSRKLKVNLEIVAVLSSKELTCVQGGATIHESAAPVACEPSGIRACPPVA